MPPILLGTFQAYRLKEGCGIFLLRTHVPLPNTRQCAKRANADLLLASKRPVSAHAAAVVLICHLVVTATQTVGRSAGSNFSLRKLRISTSVTFAASQHRSYAPTSADVRAFFISTRRVHIDCG